VDVASDPTLRAVVKAARAWGISPSKFMGARHVTTHEYDAAGRLVRSTETPEWTTEDRELAFGLEEYEAGLCPGEDHLLAETSKPEYDGAFVPDPDSEVRCHKCTARALVAEILGKRERQAGLMMGVKLDPDVVERNKLPVPPLPPEVGG